MDTSLKDHFLAQKPTVRTVTVIGFGRRFLATFVDGIVVGFASLMIAFLIGMVWVFLGWWTNAADWAWNVVILLVMLVFSVVYYTGSWVRSTGQTLGKLLMGIRIVNQDGSPLTTGKLFLRYFGYLISGLIASLGFVWVAIDKKHRGWHDLMAGTYVISIMDKFPTDGEVTFEPSDSGKSWVWVVVWLILALAMPAAAISGLWFLGPVVNGILRNLR